MGVIIGVRVKGTLGLGLGRWGVIIGVGVKGMVRVRVAVGTAVRNTVKVCFLVGLRCL